MADETKSDETKSDEALADEAAKPDPWWAALETEKKRNVAMGKDFSDRLERMKAELAAVQLPAATIVQTSPRPWWGPDTRTIIVCWMSLSTFALLVIMLYGKVPTDNQMLTMSMGAYVATGFGTVLNWWFSSSKGSDDKTQALVGDKK